MCVHSLLGAALDRFPPLDAAHIRPLRPTLPRPADAPSLPAPAAGLLMCRFAAPLAFNFMAAVAMPEVKGSDQPVGWVGGEGLGLSST